MDISYSVHPIANLTDEDRLVHQAQSGDVYAYAQLFEECVEYIYRYITFRVENDRVAEDITVWVYCKAWEKLGRYRGSGLSIIAWLYEIARKEIIAYYRTHKRNAHQDNTVTMVIGNRYLSEEVQDMVELQTIRDGLRFLPGEEQQILILKFIAGLSNKNISRIMSMRENHIRHLQFRALQNLTMYLQEKDVVINKDLQHILEDCLMKLSKGKATLNECLGLYPEHAGQLKPLLKTVFFLNSKKNFMPSPTFIAFARFAIIRFAQSHSRQPLRIALTWRTAMTSMALILTLLVTGTVHAQSAMPGDMYYEWKRTSESAWRALSPDPVAVDIILSERRLAEWIAVASNPMLSVSARKNYQEAVSRLDPKKNEKSLDLILTEFQSQQQVLRDAGLTIVELDNYLAQVNGLYIIPVTGVTSETSNGHAIRVPVNKCAPKCVSNNAGNSIDKVNNNASDKGNKGGNSAGNSNKDKTKTKDKDKDKDK